MKIRDGFVSNSSSSSSFCVIGVGLEDDVLALAKEDKNVDWSDGLYRILAHKDARERN